tara:strand:- start:14148 stop:14486 length:339 start_codon:yes stop_codon:yes gene_type:complete
MNLLKIEIKKIDGRMMNKNLFKSIHITPRLENYPLYLCSWNNGETIEVHSEETLKEEYKNSNLFNCDEAKKTMFHCNYEGEFLLDDYLKESKKSYYLNMPFHSSNMTINRIC